MGDEAGVGGVSTWPNARIGDICRAVNGRAFKPNEWDREGTPIIRIQNLKNDDAPFNYFRGAIEPKFRVTRGDLLFAWSGTPGTSFGAHIWRGGDAVLNQHIFNLHFDRTRIDERFFCYALNRNVADYVAKAQGGVGLAHITKGKFEDSLVPLPEIDEQRRIVAEIEKQFSRLDEAVAGLQRVKANLKRYKAAVLKAAVEGRLVPTEADLARREGRSYETGAQLLQRILETRRSQWQGKGKYKEPATPDTTDLPELPEGWVWASVDQLAAPELNSITDGPFGSNLKSEHYQAAGPRVIRLQNIKDGEFSNEYAHITQDHFDRLRKHEIHAGNLVIASLGDNPPRACVIPPYVGPAIVKADCIRFKPHPALATEYLNAALNCQPTRKRVKEVLHGIGRPRLSLGEIRAIALPVPPAFEQHRIVSEVDRLLSIAREAEAEVDANLKRAQGLRQAILARAFQPSAVPLAPTFAGPTETVC
jgi:type I restriction enzyme S subunit